MPIDHVGIQVAETDLAATVAFYTAALAPLGYKEMMRFPTASGTTAVGLGSGAHSDFWITGMAEKANTNTHVGFRGDRAQVDAFHAAAVKAGGKDNGAPGPRPHYGPAYYGAFVIDPAGNNAEVVCHDAPAN
ncbi:hypothetical protein MCOR27_007867 [Pyricularia oryzae]|uniref:VOC domain-containing protein n=2 Tax=Pyricularia TaxID=48558 RepID=A0ABQ8NSC5_PYRGI|nr:hypothetical protein MCOR01_011477 [Pyricularia oryzae]KAI6300474.1 hypothetical protein MCOR33_003879 [Pyricularia grisea]KAI6273395.1 hypothetical protein MCOR27_007867 [Pyricularia oryzae]KAI6311697.1 hypothetical protein MCOR34_005930 [Pyricularia oryzae]KAI6317775.1 hypothetical protein MCOR30_008980 [Pyricularia oryzae]